MKEVYIVNCCRTPIGSYGGALKDTPAVELGAITGREALRRANVSPEWVDEVVCGGGLAGALFQAAVGVHPSSQAGSPGARCMTETS